MFSTYTTLKFWACLMSFLNSHLNKLAHTILVKSCKWV